MIALDASALLAFLLRKKGMNELPLSCRIGAITADRTWLRLAIDVSIESVR